MTLRHLRRDARGTAMTEFALALPFILGIGLYGVEMANYTMVNMRVSQTAMTLADNASRAGQRTLLAAKQLRESDLSDVLLAAKQQGQTFSLTERGRITLSSLQQNNEGGQWIKWQRCVGAEHYDSAYEENIGETGEAFAGVGPAGEEITAPQDTAVMFVEVSYRYRPIISSSFVGENVIRYTAAFITRDNRDLSQVYNTEAVPEMGCNEYSA